MAENNQHFNIQDLAEKWAQGRLTPEEQAYLEQWYVRFGDEQITLTDSKHKNAEALRNAMFSRINAQIQQDEKPVRILWAWQRIAAAASILLFLSVGGYFLFHKQLPQQQTAQNQKQDLAPGRNQATLTLANGSKIILTKTLRGQIAQQGNTLIQAGSGEAITYSSTNTTATKVEYNTMSTAKGEMSPFPLILADGTKVWLNAASSITFPTAFTGNDRLVKITGEASFEVVHNAAKPFKVSVNGQTVEDIGTQFDINAYLDEPSMKTTLIEGSIRVSAGGTHKILMPGQQAQVKGNEIVVVPDADTEMAIAWKKGLFQYKDASIPAVMRQLARWYDVEIQYEGTIPDREFSGKIERNLKASQALDVLRFTKVHFRIEGKKIIVTP